MDKLSTESISPPTRISSVGDLAGVLERRGNLWTNDTQVNLYVYADEITARNIEGFTGVGSVRQFGQQWRWILSRVADIAHLLDKARPHFKTDKWLSWATQMNDLLPLMRQREPRTTLAPRTLPTITDADRKFARDLLLKWNGRTMVDTSIKLGGISDERIFVAGTTKETARLRDLFGGTVKARSDGGNTWWIKSKPDVARVREMLQV